MDGAESGKEFGSVERRGGESQDRVAIVPEAVSKRVGQDAGRRQHGAFCLVEQLAFFAFRFEKVDVAAIDRQSLGPRAQRHLRPDADGPVSLGDDSFGLSV